MPIVRPEGVRVLVHLLWPVADPDAVPLTEEAIERMVTYATRYAETLNVGVLAVGGTSDHLHLLIDLAPELSLERTVRDLMAPTQRFLRDVMGFAGFAWDASGYAAAGVSPSERERVVAYVRDQRALHAGGDLDPDLELTGPPPPAESSGDEDGVPDWLRGILNKEGESEP